MSEPSPSEPRPGAVLATFLGFGGTTFAVQVSRLVVSLIAARRLDPTGWGLWQLAYLFVTYGGLCHLGALNAMNREIPVLQGRGRSEEADRVQATALGTLVVLSVGLAAAGGAAGLLLAEGALRPLVLSAVLLFVAQQGVAFLLMAARSRVRFGLVSRYQGALAVLLPALALPATFHLGLTGFVLGQGVAMLLALSTVAPRLPGSWRPRFHLREAVALVRIGWPILAAGAGFILLTTVDRWVVAGWLGTTDLGLYGIVALAFSGLLVVPSLLSQFLYPRMARSWGETGSLAALRGWATRQSRYGLLLTAPPFLLAYFGLPPLLERYLPAYATAVPALRLGLPALIVLPAALGYGNILNILDRQRVYLGLMGVALAVNLALNVIGLRAGLGIAGVAFATTLAYGVFSLLVCIAGRRATRPPPVEPEIEARHA